MRARDEKASDTGVIHEREMVRVMAYQQQFYRSMRACAHVARLLTTIYALDENAQPAVALEYPPNRELGDLGTPVAFELARRLRKAPRAIAQEIAGAFGTLEGVRACRRRRTAI